MTRISKRPGIGNRVESDPYRLAALVYDRLFEPINRGLRLAGLRMFRPTAGMNILDVGCGTGTHLELYRRYHCNLHGIDASPAMLRVAHRRLGAAALLERASAAAMPCRERTFDLIISMLTLHEMDSAEREQVLIEMQRVLKPDGRMLLIDFRPGPYQPLKGWFSRAIIVAIEVAAGLRHFRNHRRFLALGGLQGLLAHRGMQIEAERVLAGGTLSVSLAVSSKAT